MEFRELKERTKWLCLATGVVFLAVSTYMRIVFVFESGNAAGFLLLIAMISAFSTLVLGAVSVPRWQSFIALAICGYAVYWLSGRTYAVS